MDQEAVQVLADEIRLSIDENLICGFIATPDIRKSAVATCPRNARRYLTFRYTCVTIADDLYQSNVCCGAVQRLVPEKILTVHCP